MKSNQEIAATLSTQAIAMLDRICDGFDYARSKNLGARCGMRIPRNAEIAELEALRLVFYKGTKVEPTQHGWSFSTYMITVRYQARQAAASKRSIVCG